MADEDEDLGAGYDPGPGHMPQRPTDPDELEGTAEDFTFGDAPEGDTKSTDVAIRLLRGRLSFNHSINRVIRKSGGDIAPGNANIQFVGAEMVRKLVAMIPESHRTEEFLKTVDLRPMLQAIMMAPAQVTDPKQMTTVRGVEFSQQERAVAAVLMSDEQTKITKKIEEALIEGVPPGDTDSLEQAMVTAQNMANEWRDADSVGAVPAPEGDVYFDRATSTFQASSGSNELDDFLADLNDFGEGQTPTRFLNHEELMKLVQSGDLSIDAVGAIETQPVGSRGALDGQEPSVSRSGSIQYAEAEFQDRGPNTAYGPGGNMMGSAPPDHLDGKVGKFHKDWYSVRDILRKPNDMTQDEVLAIHEKLKKAGIYDLIGSEPVVPGDTTDPAFKAAWKHLASMSLETGKPMTSILSERVTTYQEQLESQLSTNLTDPARLRLNGNAYARDQIGRKLTDEEHASLTEVIHNLERQNARIQAGLDINAGGDPIGGVEAMDEGVMADIDAQMEQYIRDENAVEAESHDTAEQYDAFTRMLAGPGRGVGV